MSHTRILDRDWTKFCQPARTGPRSKPFLKGDAKLRKSGNENGQESDFNGKTFVDVSAEMISQFFEYTDPLQNFGTTKAARERSRFLFCDSQLPLRNCSVGPQNVGPPSEQDFDKCGAPLQVKTFRQRLVVFFSFFQPGAVGCILVTRLLPF